jgi:hypothetical protein
MGLSVAAGEEGLVGVLGAGDGRPLRHRHRGDDRRR